MKLQRRVVVTGLGILSPIGNSVKDAWTSCTNGISGITKIDIGLENSPVTIGGRLKNFFPNDHLDPKELRRIDPFIQYGIIAANQSIEDSGILNSSTDLNRVGVNFGAGIGGIETIEKNSSELTEFKSTINKKYKEYSLLISTQIDDDQNWSDAAISIDKLYFIEKLLHKINNALS